MATYSEDFAGMEMKSEAICFH